MIITVSNYEREQILKTLPLPQEKIKVVYNGVSRRFKQIQNKSELVNIKEKYRLPKKFILFLGNTDPKKNLKGVLLAYSIFVENSETVIQLVIVDLKQKYLSEVLKELNLPGLQEHICSTGLYPQLGFAGSLQFERPVSLSISAGKFRFTCSGSNGVRRAGYCIEHIIHAGSGRRCRAFGGPQRCFAACQ